MAIWQFNLTAIPRRGILEKYGLIPEKLDRKSFDGFSQDLWNSTNLNVTEVIDQIDKIVKRADYGNDENWFNWKTCTDEVDNDACLSLNEVTKKVEELHFRADLREKDLIYLKRVIELAKNHDWLLMDLKGSLVEPSMDEVKESIRASNAYRFLSDPTKFLSDFEKGEIELE